MTNKKKKKGPISNHDYKSKRDITQSESEGLDDCEEQQGVIEDWEPQQEEFQDVKDDWELQQEEQQDVKDDWEPPPIHEREYELDYHIDRSYLFIFGPSSAGKTVLISSILYYLKNTRSIRYGDTLKSLNKSDLKHEIEGNKLWKELSTTLFENKFPTGTVGIKEDNPFPRHINAHFIPNNESIPDFEFCFMDMSGEDLEKVDYESERKLPESIKIYVEQMPKKNINFLYILDPKSESYNKSQQVSIFDAFIDLLDQNKHTDTPLFFVVSKWDLIKDSYPDIDVEEYIKQEYLPIWGVLNQRERQISFAEFTIGEVTEDNKLIKKYDPKYAEKVFNWFYKNQTDKSLITHTENKKKDFFSKHFKK